MGNEVAVAHTSFYSNSIKTYNLKISQKGGILGKLQRAYGIIKFLSKTTKIFEPEIIHIQVFGGQLSILSAIYFHFKRIPTLIKFTAEKSFEKTTKKGKKLSVFNIPYILNAIADRFLLKMCTAVWVTTPNFKELLRVKYGLKKEKLFLVPNFTDLTPFSKSVKKEKFSGFRSIRFLTVSRITKWPDNRNRSV